MENKNFQKNNKISLLKCLRGCFQLINYKNSKNVSKAGLIFKITQIMFQNKTNKKAQLKRLKSNLKISF